MSKEPGSAEYSIAAVSKLTGVSCHALRVWERRYGFPVPKRSASGHRRYGHDQVRLIRRLSELTQGGHSIGDLIADYRDGRLTIDDGSAANGDASAECHVAELVDRLTSGDVAGGDALFDQLAGTMDADELIGRIIGPSLVEVGDQWFRRECDVYQERGVSGFLRNKLDVMIEEARRGNPNPRHTAVIGMVQGDRHAGSTLIVSFALERAGWRVHDLGVDLPVREFQRAADAWRGDAIGLSFVLSRNINKRFQELTQIRGLPVFVGGRSILNYQGLARRYGLIPLPGPIALAIKQWAVLYEEWCRIHAGGSVR